VVVTSQYFGIEERREDVEIPDQTKAAVDDVRLVQDAIGR